MEGGSTLRMIDVTPDDDDNDDNSERSYNYETMLTIGAENLIIAYRKENI